MFKFDPEFEKNEAIYEEIRQEIIGDAGSSSDEEGEEDAENDETAAGERYFCLYTLKSCSWGSDTADFGQYGTELGGISSHCLFDDSIFA